MAWLELIYTSGLDQGTPSRRTLTLDSPSLPCGTKRPLRESPLPFPPVDSQEDSQEHGEFPIVLAPRYCVMVMINARPLGTGYQYH